MEDVLRQSDNAFNSRDVDSALAKMSATAE
jgi:hypothetical protein